MESPNQELNTASSRSRSTGDSNNPPLNSTMSGRAGSRSSRLSSASPCAEGCGGNRRPKSAAAGATKPDPTPGLTEEDCASSRPNQASMPRRRAVTEHGRAPVQVTKQVDAWEDKAIAGSDDGRSELAHLGSLSLDVHAVAHIVRL